MHLNMAGGPDRQTRSSFLFRAHRSFVFCMEFLGGLGVLAVNIGFMEDE